MPTSNPFRRAAFGFVFASAFSQIAPVPAHAQAPSAVRLHMLEPAQVAPLQHLAPPASPAPLQHLAPPDSPAPLQHLMPVQIAPLLPLRSTEPSPPQIPFTGILPLDVLMQRMETQLAALLVQLGTVSPDDVDSLMPGAKVGPEYSLSVPGFRCRDVEVNTSRNNKQIGSLVGVACREPDGAWWLFRGENTHR